ncbi:MAG: Por secretion system protein, partial [Prevotella sp.]
MRRLFTLILLLAAVAAHAQRFFNLTSDEVRVDSVLPSFGYSIPLQGDYQDSVYTATILYPEFIDMTSADVAHYRQLSSDSLPALPVVNSYVALARGQASFDVTFCPLVYREGRYQILVSFMLRVDSWPLKKGAKRSPAVYRSGASDRYAAHSVLASGSWAKIRVPSTGYYQLTDAVIRQAGFTDLNKVHIYGYGGNLQSEALSPDELVNEDDLKEVEQCIVGGRHVFYAKGPVSWSS